MLNLTLFKKLLANLGLVLVLTLANCSGDSTGEDEDADASENVDCLTKNLSVSADTDSTASGDCDTSDDDGDSDSDSDGVLDSEDSCDTIYDPDNTCTDTDGDGYADDYDNCPSLTNVEQTNTDGDSYGDDCDSNPDIVDDVENDADGDLISDDTDNCPDAYNPSQSTSGDADTIADSCDNCAEVSNEDQADTDADGEGDECDTDTDGDGILNDADNCPNAPNASQTDGDLDGVGYACDQDDTNAAVTDNDTDGDGILNDDDNCATVENADQGNADGDDEGDACDTDDDNDDQQDDVDACPTDPSEECGISPDSDGDGIPDDFDLCPDYLSTDNTDTDGDGVGDACDADPDCGEGEGTTYYRDADGDTYGDPDNAQNFCDDADHTGYVTDNTDCDDTDATINPAGADTSHDCSEPSEPVDTTADADTDGLTALIDPDDTIKNVWYYIQETVDDDQTERVSGTNKEFVKADMVVMSEMDMGWVGFINSTMIVTGVTDSSKACDYRTKCSTQRGGTSSGGKFDYPVTSGSGSFTFGSGGFSGRTSSDSDDFEYGICIQTDTTAVCDNDDTTDTDGDGDLDEDDNCPNDSNADQADSDGDGIGDTCDDANYSLDSIEIYFRGFNLDFEGDNAFEISKVGVGLDTGPVANTDFTQISHGVVSSFAKLGYDIGTDPAYYWTVYGVAVQYDSSTMKKIDGDLTISNCEDSNNYCEENVEIDVGDSFGADFSHSDDYFYVVNIDYFSITADDTLEPSVGAEDLSVSAWINNVNSETNSLDYDNDAKDGSNGNDHYVGDDGKLTLYVGANFNGPTIRPRFDARINYTITAFKKDVWGFAHYSWDKNSDSECEDQATLTNLTGIIDEEHAFIMPYSLGYNSSQDATREIDRIRSRVTLDSVSPTSDSAVVYGYGCVTGHKGISESDDDFYINANDTKGYLLYCKDENVCKTKQGNTEDLYEANCEGTCGDADDIGSFSIEF